MGRLTMFCLLDGKGDHAAARHGAPKNKYRNREFYRMANGPDKSPKGIETRRNNTKQAGSY